MKKVMCLMLGILCIMSGCTSGKVVNKTDIDYSEYFVRSAHGSWQVQGNIENGKINKTGFAYDIQKDIVIDITVYSIENNMYEWKREGSITKIHLQQGDFILFTSDPNNDLSLGENEPYADDVIVFRSDRIGLSLPGAISGSSNKGEAVINDELKGDVILFGMIVEGAIESEQLSFDLFEEPELMPKSDARYKVWILVGNNLME